MSLGETISTGVRQTKEPQRSEGRKQSYLLFGPPATHEGHKRRKDEVGGGYPAVSTKEKQPTKRGERIRGIR